MTRIAPAADVADPTLDRDQPSTQRLHKLAALRLLGEWLRKIEAQREPRLERGDNAADVDQEAAQLALNGVLTFFQDYGIESRPLVRLLSGLVALSAGSSPPDMLAPAPTRHRRPISPVIESMKGICCLL